MIACPSCGRDNVGVQTLAEVVEERLRAYPQHFEVAVLGCAVNGPGEAGDADFGIAGGRDVGFIYAHGRVLKKVSSDILVDELFHEIDAWIAGGMHRPKRLKMAKPAALAMAEASQIPLDWRVHQRIVQIIREEMDAIGGQEMLMPLLTPLELWQHTKRDHIAELFKLKDRAGRDYVLPMTHEETVTFHAREIQSYKQLPKILYHFSVKDRDEPRPRGGLIRVREFIMKDAYSFDRDEGGLDESFRKHSEVYKRIFERCGIEALEVAAESGIMGGSGSRDFLAPSGSGENTLVTCDNGDYAADLEIARGKPSASTRERRRRRCRWWSTEGWCSRSSVVTTASTR